MFLTYQLNESINDNLKWLRYHNELCDVLLISGNHRVLAHSCVLGSHSTVLAAILQARLFGQNDWSILKPLIISIDEDLDSMPEDANETSILELLITFLYGEKISIHTTRIQKLINFSKLLGLSQHFCDHSPADLNADQSKCVRKKSRRKPLDAQSNESSHVEQADTEDVEVPSKDESKLLLVHEEKSHLRKVKKSKLFKTKKGKCNVKLGRKLNRKSSGILNKEHKLVFKEPADFNNELGSPNEKYFKTDFSSRLTSETSAGAMINHDNFIDAESWFKNELFNSIDMKVTIKCEETLATGNNINAIESEERNHTETLCSKDEHLGKSSSNSQLKRPSRIATCCSVCKSSFHKASDFIKHIKDENHYNSVCPLCFVQLDEFEDQKNHFLQHDHPLPFFCFCCDLRFRSRAGLSMHAPKHSDTKPYTCKECGRGFKWRHSAQAHSITHRSHCHLLCDICGFSSKYMSTFKSHLKRHYDQFFPCPHPGCKFKSFRKAHLNDHYATHTKLRPHQCEVCGHSFSHAKNLRRHMRLHTADTCFLKCALYSNQECQFKTTRPDKLRFHLIQKHNLEYHDKISLPVVPPRLPIEDEMPGGPDLLKKESLTMNVMREFGSLQSHEYSEKEEVFGLEGHSGKDRNEDKVIEVSAMSSGIGDILLNDQSSMMTSEDRMNAGSLCIPDSYETYIIPTSTHENTVIVSENIDYSNQGIEGDATLVLMENIQVLNNMSDGNVSSDEIQTSSYDEKNDSSANKIEEMMTNLPAILEADKGMAYLEDGVNLTSGNENNAEFSESNLGEFELNRTPDIALDDTNRNIQLIKLPDGSFGFLPQVQDEAPSLSVGESSIILEESEIKDSDQFSSTQFNLNSLF